MALLTVKTKMIRLVSAEKLKDKLSCLKLRQSVRWYGHVVSDWLKGACKDLEVELLSL